MDGETKDRVEQILGDNLDWDYILKKASSQGISPLLYYNLKDKEAVPDKIKERLREIYYSNSARNMLLLSKLGEVLKTFNEAKIQVIVLKGAALLETVYSNIGLRPIADLDLLVHKKDLSEIKDSLNKLGYQNSKAYPEDFFKEGAMIDLHWDLMNITRVGSRGKAYEIELNNFWENSERVKISGAQTQVLSPEHLLIDLCLHLTLHHGLSRLIWFTDILEVIRFYREKIDWDKFIREAKGYKVEKAIYYTFFYTKEILGDSAPEVVLERLKPLKKSFLEKKFLDLILNNEQIENVRFFLTLIMMRNFLDKIKFLREIVLPSPKVLTAIYSIPPSKIVLPYYLRHFQRILSTTFKAARKALFS
jgi:hypothetical protein